MIAYPSCLSGCCVSHLSHSPLCCQVRVQDQQDQVQVEGVQSVSQAMQNDGDADDLSNDWGATDYAEEVD